MKKEKEVKYITKKTWAQFRKSGMLFFVNSILHFLGWAIVVNFETYNKKTDSGKIVEVYPARVKFRGFDDKSTTKGHKQVAEYLYKNSVDLLEESKL